MDGAKVSFLHVSQNVPTDSPMEVGDNLISSKKGTQWSLAASGSLSQKYNVFSDKCLMGHKIEEPIIERGYLKGSL